MNDLITRKFFRDSPFIGSYLIVLINDGTNSVNKILELNAISIYGKETGAQTSKFYCFYMFFIQTELIIILLKKQTKNNQQ